MGECVWINRRDNRMRWTQRREKSERDKERGGEKKKLNIRKWHAQGDQNATITSEQRKLSKPERMATKVDGAV